MVHLLAAVSNSNVGYCILSTINKKQLSLKSYRVYFRLILLEIPQAHVDCLPSKLDLGRKNYLMGCFLYERERKTRVFFLANIYLSLRDYC